jgi:hypothetical protein
VGDVTGGLERANGRAILEAGVGRVESFLCPRPCIGASGEAENFPVEGCLSSQPRARWITAHGRPCLVSVDEKVLSLIWVPLIMVPDTFYRTNMPDVTKSCYHVICIGTARSATLDSDF